MKKIFSILCLLAMLTSCGITEAAAMQGGAHHGGVQVRAGHHVRPMPRHPHVYRGHYYTPMVFARPRHWCSYCGNYYQIGCYHPCQQYWGNGVSVRFSW